MHKAELAEYAYSVISSCPNAYLFSLLSSHLVIIKVKQKWQKIVNKGLECRPCSVASSADASTIVFNGIKEGVQRVSRLLLARFLYTLPPSSYPTISTQSGQCFLLSLNKYHNAAVAQTILIWTLLFACYSGIAVYLFSGQVRTWMQWRLCFSPRVSVGWGSPI